MSEKTLKDKLQQQLEAKGIVLEEKPGEEKEEVTMSEERKIESNDECTEIQSVEEMQPLAMTMEEAKKKRKILKEFVSEIMIEGQDYGVIPGFSSKPSLFKSGAELICQFYGYSSEVEVLNRLEDWEKGIFHYEVKVRLLNKDGVLQADGIGSANSKEKKYANQNSFTMVNTILKIAAKRAYVSATISACFGSSFFTVDLEDLRDMVAPCSSAENTPQEPITKPQIMKIKMLGKDLNFSKDDAISLLEKDYGVTCTTELTKRQATQLIKQLLAQQEAS